MLKISKGDEGFSDLAFVVEARAGKKAESRFCLSRMVVSDGVMSCTDGHRLHQAFAGLPDGQYEVVKATKREVWLEGVEPEPWPEVERVYVDMRGFEDVEHWGGLWGATPDTSRSLLAFKLARAMSPDTALDVGFLVPFQTGEEWTFHVGQGQDPVYFSNGTKWGAIMPLSA